MNVKRNVAFLLVLAMFASLTACSLGSTASTPAPAESKAAEPAQSQAVGDNDGPVETEDTIVLRYASSDTTANWNEVDGLSNAESDKFMVDEIFKRTNGRYKIEVYPDGQLATGITEQVAGIRNGDFEITSIPVCMLLTIVRLIQDSIRLWGENEEKLGETTPSIDLDALERIAAARKEADAIAAEQEKKEGGAK